ncbi:hypothetical protein ACFQ0B_23380 [Nonomuraea thailandensis]|nr:hypothetical protein [Nonomuraea thailandensis]
MGVATAQLSAAGAAVLPAPAAELKDPAVAVNAMIQATFMEPPLLHVFL